MRISSFLGNREASIRRLGQGSPIDGEKREDYATSGRRKLRSPVVWDEHGDPGTRARCGGVGYGQRDGAGEEVASAADRQ